MWARWTGLGILLLHAGVAVAADLPDPVTHEDFPTPGATSVLLGRDLFFDPILSGNGNISCAACHHPALGSGDAISLSLGEGGIGLGPARTGDTANMPPARIPRNAPALYNLGAFEFTTLFHDGRVERDTYERFDMRMPPGFELERPVSSALAAQAILPLLSHHEMAGQPGENPVADAVEAGHIRGLDGAWQMIATRVEQVPAYRTRFDWIIGPDEPIHISDVGRAIADYITFEFRATDSAFDAFLRGAPDALGPDQFRGMQLFYGKAKCATCHSGTFQTDHAFHAIGIPQFGPGKGHGAGGYADHGRGFVTGKHEDYYRFRTPSLRNVTLTAPYGHNGAYKKLEDMVRHHLDPLTMLAEYTLEYASLPEINLDGSDTNALEDFDEMLAIGIATEIAPVPLTDPEVAAIMAFLSALEDPISDKGARLGVPDMVPSGLPLDAVPDPS